MSKTRRRFLPNSFTLVELLVVMAIIALMASISIPAVMSLMRSSNLSTGGNRLADHLNLCRQQAMAKNCEVEVRFYQLPDPTSAATTTPAIYRAFQSFTLDYGGTQTNALTKVVYLPDRIYMATNSVASPLLVTSNPSNPPYAVAGTSIGVALGTYPTTAYNYIDFHFKPDGSTDLAPSFTSPWYVSLANQSDKIQNATTGLPSNFVTVQIDATTGRVRYFRPN